MPARVVIALAVVFCVVATGGAWIQSGSEAVAAHGPHALGSDWPAEFGVVAAHQHPIVEHPHAQDGSNRITPDSFAAAGLRRVGTTTLVALSLAAAMVAMVALWFYAPLTAVRGPPRVAARILSARAILARLCIARC
ncbi:hypothetical protein NGTWS0302_07690 [Mycolicibacterium cyprinidarum]|uniref:Lipoprotein LpqS n=1 Tax=Mycolicibacterium cyprinidarum TaxID=2860311 RepID=A0ABQ4VAK0_9MYCO|nr:hypothetical protein NGTWS1702_35630 [Mycolicibacterium sp. NGTWSNA01]GJF14831.1 hypothetical protein NGTWS0302_07690 [Mycolicibacterium sp. NGTWS0302]GJF17816.1 hypothetical protein NGTWS1803_36060 [Mycolicibacterium sp. NGTWS1803]